MSDDQELSVDTDKSVNGLPNAPKDLNSLSELEDDEKELNFNRCELMLHFGSFFTSSFIVTFKITP